MLPFEIALLLVVIGLFAGIGITAIGPGGIFSTVALFLLTPLSPAEVVGTASATFVAAGLIGSAVYVHSDEFELQYTREVTVGMSLASIGGAFVGTRLNLFVSEAIFSWLLAVFVTGIGLLIIGKELDTTYQLLDSFRPRGHKAGPILGPETARWMQVTIAVVIGFGIGVVGGLLGVGGPVLAVPILVVLGVPMLLALAIAQVQSVFVSGMATAGYLAIGAVSWPIAGLVGIPQLVGVVIGWRIAHLVPAQRLRLLLGCVLIGITPVLLP